MRQAQVQDDPEQGQFQLQVDGQTAFIEYRQHGDTIDMIHTEVPRNLEGQGVGSHLVKGALELLRERGQTLIPSCPFVTAYLKRHPSDLDLVSADQRAEFGL